MNSLVVKAERGGHAAWRALASLVSVNAALLGGLFLLLLAATVTLIGIFFPLVQWDLIAYVATILERTVSDPTLLHAQTYETVRHAISHGDFIVLTQDRPYRAVQYSDPSAFLSMLGFYRVKWLYIQAISFAAHFMPPVSAIRLVSAVSAGVIGLTMFVWLAGARRLAWAPLVAAMLMLCGYGYVARLATPDAFASMFFFIGVLAYLKRAEPIVGVFLLAAFLARPDHLAFIGIFMVVSLYLRPVSIGAIAAFVAGLIVYVPLTQAAGHPGWWVQFWFTDIEYVPTIEGFSPDFSLILYIKAWVMALVRSMVDEAWLGVLIAAMFGWAAMERAGLGPGRRERVLMVSLLLSIVAKFVLLPLHETRFHFATMVVIGMLLITALPAIGRSREASGCRPPA